MSEPSVTVLVTVYNRKSYLKEAVESIINQSYENWEMIILDDKSSDDSFELAKKLAAPHDKITVLQNEKNLGQFPTRNKIAALGTGKYLKYLDSDDFIYPHSLRIMVEAMEAYPSAAFGFQHQLRDDLAPYPILLSPEKAFEEHFLSKNGLFNCGPSGVIFRREYFEKEGGFKSDNYTGNDTELLIRLGLKYPSMKLQPALVWWRSHHDQAFGKAVGADEYALNEMNMQYSFLQKAKSNIAEQKRLRAIRALKWKTARKILIQLRKGNVKLAYKMFKSLPVSLIDLIKGLGKHPILYA